MDETFSLIDQLLDKGLDYLHIATTNAWAGARRGSGSETEKSRTQLLAEYIAGRIPLVGVCNIQTGADVDKVMSEAGADLIAVGRALVVDPHWVEKVQHNNESSIRRELTIDDQQEAVIPIPLWKLILEVEGWFPVKHGLAAQ